MSVGILGLTESQFVAQAKHLDLTPAAAARGWRQLFREGTLPAALEGKVQLPSMPIVRREPDGATLKFAQQLEGGLETESVILPQRGRTGRIRTSLCVSSQVGCAMGCRFCETATLGRRKQLTPDEIVGQWFAARHSEQQPITNIVFMGMGEPLLNSSAVLEAIRCLNDDLGIGQRRITVSTVGVPKTLPQLAELAMQRLGRAQFTLAVSLHAPNQRLREELIPTAHAYPYDALLEDCRHYLEVTGRRVSFEYILLGELNDQPEHAAELADRVGGFQSHVNLIAYNPIEEEEFKRPTPQRIEAFRRVLERRGVAVSLRASRGLDQNAACGQLRRQQMAPNSSGS